MSPYRRAWVAWALFGFGGFCAIESLALRQQRIDDTLSAVTRDLLGLHPHRQYSRISQPAFALGMAGFVGWFVPHIFRIPQGDTPVVIAALVPGTLPA